MKTIALRFGDHFAPKCGTIAAHQGVIDDLGYVWYGKMGTPVSVSIIESLRALNEPRILLINSGKTSRYWAYISDVTRDTPDNNGIPKYYRNQTEKFKTWFKVTRFEPAPKNIMAQCYVVSSGASLSTASRHSMSPYFIINYTEEEEK